VVKIPLKVYLLEPLERLKVFVIEGDIIRTPVDINIACLVQKYNFNPEYDRFRFWGTMHSFEEKHTHEIKPFQISPLIPVRLTIRKLNVEQDWMVHGHIWAEGTFQFLSNDDGVALKFMKDVFENVPPTMETALNLNCNWKTDKSLLAFFVNGLTGAFGWFFGEKGNIAKYAELYKACLRFLQGSSKRNENK